MPRALARSSRSSIRARASRASLAALLAGVLAPAAGAQGEAGTQPAAAARAVEVSVTEVARGLEHPWSLAFLPDGRMLVTERPGRLRVVTRDGRVSEPVAGVPEVQARGQGGLLDVLPSPSFASDRTIFLSYAAPAPGGARTAVARAELAADGAAPALRNLKVIFEQKDVHSGGNHFGSRLVFGRDGTLFVTTGDRFWQRDRAQDLASHLGKVIRIRPDGTVPSDNPFAKAPGAAPEVWSYGHRNLQGAALHPATGRLWTHEHGPQGGDELNVSLPGRNYGWPVITYGREYVIGTRIGEGTERADVQSPVHQWTPSIAPSGMAFYTGDRYPGWKGSLFIGSLKFRMLSRIELDGEKFVREERLLADLNERIRDVRQGPDGYLYLLTDDSQGRILRVEAR